jgi:7-cyano-7-deazaguanine synthase in queuosine biosynthesis
MWSGGIDSTYVLAKMLKETDNNIFTHHICLHNFERRGDAEVQALKKLMPKLQAIRPFMYTENLIDDSRMPTMVYDMARVCFEAGAVSKAFYHYPKQVKLDRWTIGTHEAEGHNWERWEFIGPATRAAEWTKGRTEWIEFELPEMVNKKEEMRYLKELGLLDECWYCRTPIPDVELKTYKTCGKCKTCYEVKEN